MAKLKKFGYHLIEPDSGYLACGITGIGRLPDPGDIVDYRGTYEEYLASQGIE